MLTNTDQPASQDAPTRQRVVAGVWAELADSTSLPGGPTSVWQMLRDCAAQPSAQTTDGLFTELRQRADPGQYCPKALPDIPEESIIEDGEVGTVIHSPTGHYLVLSPVDRAVWHAMDGAHTIGGLAMVAFTQFHKLFDRTLVDSLRDNGFLEERPIHVYRQLQDATAARTAEGWGRRLLRTLWGRRIAIGGIDRFYSILYRTGAWLFFTPPVLALLLVIAVVGFGAYLRTSEALVTQVVAPAGSGLTGSVLALYIALLVSFILHESAHALAVKHYNRVVIGGGVMLYCGLPAAFVDTSDMWCAQRWPRIAVSAAGPISDLVVGGTAALVVAFAPAAGLWSEAAYRLATMCYVATLFNLNPLLELDGYHILVDLLRLPRLRTQSFDFVRRQLGQKLYQRIPFSHNERIFATYGLFAAVYTVVAIAAAALFWERLIQRLISALWNNGLVGKIVALVLVVGLLVPIGIGLLLVGWGVVRGAAAYLHRRGYDRRPALLAAAWIALLLLLALGTSSALPVLTACYWTLGLAALGALVPDHRGAQLLPALYALACAAAFGVASALIGWLLPDTTHSVSLIIDGLGLLLVMVAAFASFLDSDVQSARPAELAWIGLLVALAFGAGAVALDQAQQSLPETGFAVHVVIAAPAYFGAIALALWLPYILGLRGSRLVWGWMLVWVGMLIQMVAYMSAIAPASNNLLRTSMSLVPVLSILAAGLCAGGWLMQAATLRQLPAEDLRWVERPAINEAQRLQRALRLCYAGCYRYLRTVYGRRRARSFNDRMTILAATGNWDVTIEREQVRFSESLRAATLDLQGSQYAEILRYTVTTIEDLAGASFARRAIRAAYDALPWPEREAAGRRCFPDTPWAAELSSAFGAVRDRRLHLLRELRIFAACDDDELAALVAVVETQRVRAGQQLLTIGEIPPGMWIVEAGEIAARDSQGHVVEELRRGAYVGVDEPEVSPTELSYRATMESELLFLPALNLRPLLPTGAQVEGGLPTQEVLMQLERVPLFADIPRHTLRELARAVKREERPARSVVVREGLPSGTFYLIIQGEAAVIARSQSHAGDPTALKVIARIGPEEFFGELELLRGTPPVASVVALTPLVLFALPHTALAALISNSGIVAHGIEQVGTGRLLDLRQRLLR